MIEILRNLFDLSNPSVFWAAVSGSVALLVAIASFVKWLSSQQTETKSRENQTEGDPILYPYGLLAFICLLVFAGVVVGALTNWSGTFWLAVVAIVATTSTFWANVVFAVIASKREKRGGGAHHKPRH